MTTTDLERHRWWILLAVGGVLGLTVLDETVVGVALPSIRDDLAMSQVASHWVVNAYLLVFASLIVGAGRLSDIVGIRTLFLIGAAIFGLGSFACGFATSGTWILAARAVQGIGAAIIFPLALAIISAVFPAEERGKALGFVSLVATFFIAAGPFVGGLLTEVLSWRWIFWINLPFVAAIGSIIAVVWREAKREAKPPRFDTIGLVVLIAGMATLVGGVMQGPDWGWSDIRVLIMLAAGILILIAFVAVERRVADPLVNMELFRNKTFSGSAVVIFTGQFVKLSVFVFGSLYLQDVLDMSPLGAGAVLLAAVALGPPSAPLAGIIADRYGTRRPTLWGLALSGLAFVWFALVADGVSYLYLLPPLIILSGTGVFFFTPPLRAVMNAVTAEQRGLAGGVARGIQQVGGTAGMAICGTLLAMTGSFPLIFAITAAMIFLAFVAAWFTIECDQNGKGGIP
ncbi:MAG: DHA2 family efflux MFS transporter permease subunit [Pseudomonadota bacterium]